MVGTVVEEIMEDGAAAAALGLEMEVPTQAVAVALALEAAEVSIQVGTVANQKHQIPMTRLETSFVLEIILLFCTEISKTKNARRG